MQATRGARQFLCGRGFLTMQYCCIETLLQVLLGTVKDVIDTSFPYSTAFLPVLHLLRLARPKI